MSYTTMLGVLESGDVEHFDEYRNGHGAGPYIWHVIFSRRGVPSYGDPVPYSYDLTRPTCGYMTCDGGSLISNDYLKHCSVPEAWALAMTFDNCVITKEVAPEAARWLRSFLENVSPWISPNSVNHWPKILALLESMPTKYVGLAINHTSCGDCEMYSGVWDGDDEDEDEEPRPYNINVDDSHFLLSAERMAAWMNVNHDDAEGGGA